MFYVLHRSQNVLNKTLLLFHENYELFNLNEVMNGRGLDHHYALMLRTSILVKINSKEFLVLEGACCIQIPFYICVSRAIQQPIEAISKTLFSYNAVFII